MKVEALIKQLQEFNPDADVVLATGEDEEMEERYRIEFLETEPGRIEIWFDNTRHLSRRDLETD